MSDAAVARPHLAALAAELDVETEGTFLAETLAREIYLGFIDRPGLTRLLREACHAKVRVLRDQLAGIADPADVDIPAAVALAHELARAGVPTETVERSYRVGQEAVWRRWLDAVEAYAAATGAPIPPILRATTPIMFGFVDRMLALTMTSYNDALDADRRTLAQRRRVLVDQLLDGSLPAPSTDAERLLNYRLDGTHLALVLDGAGAAADIVPALRETLGATAALVVGGPDALGWLRLARPLTAADRDAVARCVAGAGGRAALGEPAEDLPGFCSSHADARVAAQVADAAGDDRPAVVWARDVRIEALGVEAAATARRLVAAELPGLDELPPRARDALEAWLVTGSHVGAAARLGVHEHTIRNRLRRVDDLLGPGWQERRTELHVALRLAAVV